MVKIDDVKKEENFKKKYYALIRELQRICLKMDSRCPMVKSCCGGCVTIRNKLKREKKETQWISKNE